MKATISYKKWWWKFIPKKRKELRVMQLIVDHLTSKPEFEKEMKLRMKRHFIYGEPVEEVTK